MNWLIAVGSLVFAVTAPWTATSAATPAGRAWTAVDRLNANGHRFMFPCRFEPTSGDTLRLVGSGLGGPGKWLTGFEWRDSLWVTRWIHKYASFVAQPVAARNGREVFMWKTQLDSSSGLALDYMLMSVVSGDSLATPDTIGTVYNSSFHYSGAVTDSCQFALVYDVGLAPVLRAFVHSAGRPGWTSRTLSTDGRDGVSAAAIDDTTCLVVTDDFPNASPVWGLLTPTTWTPSAAPLDTATIAYPSLLRQDGNGGYWLFSGIEEDHVLVAHWRVGVGWAERDTLNAEYPPGVYHATKGVYPTQDDRRLPVVTWSAMSGDGLERVYVAWPKDSSWTTGTLVPGSEDGGAQVASRDGNGDVWVAWFGNFDGIFWSHTYTRAVSDTPSVGQSGSRPLVRWTLSELAPESMWTLWRAAGGGAFEQVARLAAGDGMAMSAVDSTAPDGEVLRYRVRRECLDARFQWTSAEAVWLPHTARLAIALRSRNPAPDGLDVDLLGANTGAVSLELYDLQGRIVASARMTALGSGRDAVHVDLRGIAHPGLYLLRARSADHRASAATKIAIVR